MAVLDLLEALSREADERPDDPEVWLRLTEALLEQNAVEPARHLLARARNSEPSTAKQWRQLGELGLRLDEPGPALEALRAAVVLDGDDFGTVALFARTALEQGHAEEAEAMLRECLARRDDPELRLVLGMALARRGEHTAATRAVHGTGSPPRGPAAPRSVDRHDGGDPSSGVGFTGDLEVFSLPDILEFLALQRATGSLEITSKGRLGTVRMAEGLVVEVSHPDRPSLVWTLIAEGRLSRARLNQIPVELMLDEPALGRALVERGLMDGDAVRDTFRSQVEDGIYVLLGWKEGHVRFHTVAAAQGAQVEGFEARWVLMSALKRIDEERR
ncbi:MAG: DUF4388 domain-containing protein [Deltaproteobacteria bacterium]|nr:DUF4388 domain-containing protein [Deltaproteobacteria bacterium]